MPNTLSLFRCYSFLVLTTLIVTGSACVVGDDPDGTGGVTTEDTAPAVAQPLAAAIARGSCVVKVNGVAVRTLSARDRNDCYAKSSYGSANCTTYAPYLRFGVTNVIEQLFDGTDRVNSDTCVLPPLCVVKVRGVVVTTMSTPDRLTCYNRTSFGSENCAVYAPYLTAGSNLIEQYFAGTDRVNSDTCAK